MKVLSLKDLAKAPIVPYLNMKAEIRRHDTSAALLRYSVCGPLQPKLDLNRLDNGVKRHHVKLLDTVACLPRSHHDDVAERR